MDIKTLEIIISISDSGSFNSAARKVNLSPSAISLRMKTLEDQLCVPLFDRSQKAPVLNSEGHAFVERAREIAGNWQKLIDDFKPVRRYYNLHVGVVPTSLQLTVPQAMSVLRKSIPNLHIKLTTGLSDRLGEMVERGELDCAIVSEAIKLADNLEFRAFVSQPLIVIAPHDLMGDTDIDLLESAPYIRFNKHTWAGTRIEQQLNVRQINLNITMEVDTLDGIFALVSNGLGVSVIPQIFGTNDWLNNVRIIPFGSPPVHRIVGLLEQRGNSKRDITNSLFNALLDTVEQHNSRGCPR